jgi:hypothetical protein
VISMACIDEKRNLMRSECPFDGLAVDDFGAGPALGRAQHDHRPAWSMCRFARSRILLKLANIGNCCIHNRRHSLVHDLRIITFHEARRPAATFKKIGQIVAIDPGEDRWVADLIAIEMQDRQHRAVGDGAQKLVGLPSGREWPGFGLTVTDDAGNNQIGIVKGCTECVAQRIAEFSAFMN